MTYKYGYLRETQEQADKTGPSKENGLCRTGLDTYLKVIFPDIKDWVHDQVTGIPELGKRRPDYRSESLKLIVEFDGVHHFKSEKQLYRDKDSAKLYEKYGYKVVRIPWFIQLTTKAVEKLFSVKVTKKLFPECPWYFSPDQPFFEFHSFSKEENPGNMCYAGVYECASYLSAFPDQCRGELSYLRFQTMQSDDYGLEVFEKFLKWFNYNAGTRTIFCSKVVGINPRPKKLQNQLIEGEDLGDCVIRAISVLENKPYMKIKRDLDKIEDLLDEGRIYKKNRKAISDQGYNKAVMDIYLKDMLGYIYIDASESVYFWPMEEDCNICIPDADQAILLCPRHAAAYANGVRYELDDGDLDTYDPEDILLIDIEGMYIKPKDKMISTIPRYYEDISLWPVIYREKPLSKRFLDNDDNDKPNS